MIVPMEKLFLAGPKSLVVRILNDLQATAAIHVDSARNEDVTGHCLDEAGLALLRRWDSIAIAADHTLRLLGITPDAAAQPFGEGLEAAEAEVQFYEQHAAELVERRRTLLEEIEFIGHYRKAAERLAGLVEGVDESPWLTALPFLVPADADLTELSAALSEAVGGRFELAHGTVGDGIAAVVIVLQRDAAEARGALGRRGLSELPRPEPYHGMGLNAMAAHLARRAEEAPRDLAAVDGFLDRLAAVAEQGLKALWVRGRNEALRLRTLEQVAGGRYGFVFTGWVPTRFKSRVVAALAPYADRTHYLFEPGDDVDAGQIPVSLENPAWASPFEKLILFLNTPRYDGWDPTWVVAAFFPLWFGMIVGDLGYALIFAAAALYLWWLAQRGRPFAIDFFSLRLPPPSTLEVVRVMKPMIAWTVVWGLLYGECFGDLFLRWGVFGTADHPGWLPVLIPRTDTAATANFLILISIAFGAWQVLYGFYRKARYTRRHGAREHYWEAVGYFAGVAALIVFAVAFMTQDFSRWLMVPTVLGAAVFLIGMGLSKTPLMVAELPTQAGHILSYIRIYAVGLASAVLAGLATDAGFALHRTFGAAGLVAGVLAGLLLGVVMHAVLLALLTVGHVLQPIRLIWVEFFTKFDFYSISGRPFRPFGFVGAGRRGGSDDSPRRPVKEDAS